ncbi:MAG: YdjY domain-containing protein, partial [Planctomycetota bacterium]
NPAAPPGSLPPADPATTAETLPQRIYPGVVIDRAAGHVDLRGRVVGRHVDWLELLACRPGTREHEAVVTLDAEATHIQLALILLGLEPGSPARYENRDGQIEIFPPRGPAVELFFVLDDQPDTETPAHRWVVAQDTGEVLPDNRWLFVGSRRVEHAGKTWFLAEENGTLVSLVNFGDELIGRPTQQSEDGGNVFWTANAPLIPEAGTPITLRVRPAEETID